VSSFPTKNRIPDDERLRAAITTLLRERQPGKSICPSEAARAIAGPDEKLWRLLMKPVRQVAVEMAKAGQIRILRKGKAVAEPDGFRGVYRLALPLVSEPSDP
jgi:hypothetical protein